ncbi:MAG: hypothetical protein WD872_06220, partial [Pirellulaceae bacterium]
WSRFAGTRFSLARYAFPAPAGEPTTLYCLRRSFATRMTKVLPADRLAKSMGHKDGRMLAALYDHSVDDAGHMLDLQKRPG